MRFAVLLSSLAVLASAAPALDTRSQRCCDAKCYKRLEYGDSHGHPASSDCKSFLRATATACPKTTTKTIKATKTVTITSTAVPPSSTPISTTTTSSIDSTVLLIRDDPTQLVERNSPPSCTVKITKPSNVPQYAQKDCKQSDWASACSCLGVKPTTTTLPVSTVTKTVTKIEATTTKTVCATSTATPITVSNRSCARTYNADRLGGDIRGAAKKTGSFDACINYCAGLSGCVSAQYHQSNGYCYPKDSSNPIVAACGVDTVDCGPPLVFTNIRDSSFENVPEDDEYRQNYDTADWMFRDLAEMVNNAGLQGGNQTSYGEQAVQVIIQSFPRLGTATGSVAQLVSGLSTASTGAYAVSYYYQSYAGGDENIQCNFVTTFNDQVINTLDGSNYQSPYTRHVFQFNPRVSSGLLKFAYICSLIDNSVEAATNGTGANYNPTTDTIRLYQPYVGRLDNIDVVGCCYQD